MEEKAGLLQVDFCYCQITKNLYKGKTHGLEEFLLQDFLPSFGRGFNFYVVSLTSAVHVYSVPLPVAPGVP